MANNQQDLTNMLKDKSLNINTTITSDAPGTSITTDQDALTTTQAASDNAKLASLSADNTKGAYTLELLAERPVVDIERVMTGNVKLSKQIRTQTVNVPVTLTQEVLVVEYEALENLTDHTVAEHRLNASQAWTDEPFDNARIDNQTSSPHNLVKVVTLPAEHATTRILVNGQPIALTDTPTEIVISQQVANVSISTNVVEEVHLTTQVQSHEQTIPITLRHEELVVDETRLDTPQTMADQQTVTQPWFTR